MTRPETCQSSEWKAGQFDCDGFDAIDGVCPRGTNHWVSKLKKIKVKYLILSPSLEP